LHILSGLTFFLVHGVAVAVAFKLRAEEAIERVRAILELSESVKPALYASLIGVLVTGIILGFMGHWWRMAWIWISLVLLTVITLWMIRYGERHYGQLRKAVGLPYRLGFRDLPPEKPVGLVQIKRIILR